MNNIKNNKKGFSLIELMVVIIILGLLASLVVPGLLEKSEKAKNKIACIQMKNLKEAVLNYKMEKNKYPKELKDLIGNQLEKKSQYQDPWNNDYILDVDKKAGMGKKIEIISLGEDQEEGEGDFLLSECK
jgi:general secretion pathway protein G